MLNCEGLSKSFEQNLFKDFDLNLKSGEIIEFVDDEIEKLQKKVAEKYGYKLVDHKLELYGIKKK